MENLHETGKRAVKGLFNLVRKDTSRQLVILQVIGNTIAALALPGARLIGAIAPGGIHVNLAFHTHIPFRQLYRSRILTESPVSSSSA